MKVESTLSQEPKRVPYNTLQAGATFRVLGSSSVVFMKSSQSMKDSGMSICLNDGWMAEFNNQFMVVPVNAALTTSDK